MTIPVIPAINQVELTASTLEKSPAANFDPSAPQIFANLMKGPETIESIPKAPEAMSSITDMLLAQSIISKATVGTEFVTKIVNAGVQTINKLSNMS